VLRCRGTSTILASTIIPFFCLIAGIIQKPAKQGKELLDRPRTSYSLTKQPDGLFVGYRIFRTSPDKPSKRKTIYQLKLGLGIGEGVHVLQDHDLKHHDVIKRRSAGIALSRLAKGLSDYRLKLLPVNDLSKSLQGVFKLAQRLQFLLNIKKSKADPCFSLPLWQFIPCLQPELVYMILSTQTMNFRGAQDIVLVKGTTNRASVSYLVPGEERGYHWIKSHLRLIGNINDKRGTPTMERGDVIESLPRAFEITKEMNLATEG
jgi:hypothetical protein